MDALAGLAGEAKDQLARLDRQGGLDADELFHDFDAMGSANQNMLEMGELNASEQRAIAVLLDHVMRARNSIWRRDALATEPEWVEIRKRAGATLELLRTDCGATE